MRVQLLRGLVAALFIVGTPQTSAASSSALRDVNYGAFTQTATYSIANQLGFFTAYGLNVTYLQIPNSTYGYAQLLSGGYEILTGTLDNAVNLRFNSNRSLTVTGQLDQGPELTIAAVPNITRPAQLQGKSLMVDSPVSGYAYILRKVLSLYGLNLENGDYTFQTVGSTNTRYADLIAGHLPNGSDVYATILTYPFTSQAAAITPNGPNILARISDFIQPFSSSAFTIRESAINNSTERATLRSFMSAMYAANQYLTSNPNCSIQAIATQLNVSTAVATSAYNSAIDPLTGETASANFTVNRQGILNVIDVRSQFGGFATVPAHFDFAEAIVPGAGKLIDYAITEEAIEAMNGFEPVCDCF